MMSGWLGGGQHPKQAALEGVRMSPMHLQEDEVKLPTQAMPLTRTEPA